MAALSVKASQAQGALAHILKRDPLRVVIQKDKRKTKCDHTKDMLNIY